MTMQFKTRQDAAAAGYRSVRESEMVRTAVARHVWSLDAPDGTVTVHLTEAKNKIGGIGAWCEMWPPDVDLRGGDLGGSPVASTTA